MCFGSKKIDLNQYPPKESPPETQEEVKSRGRTYSCKFDGKKFVGLVALILAAAMIVMSGIVASGIFGAGALFFVAGALVIGAMITLILGGYFLISI